MKIAFNPSTVAALTTPPNNKDITFDLRGRNIFARGVKFYGTDTNTWRDIKVNNVSIGSHTLDLRNGTNTTLTNTNGVVTINSTWRPVVDNLTSDSTTSSLSAKQGKVLKALIDGKSDSGHTHDGRYVRYYAVTTLDCNNLAAGLTVARVNATNAGAAYHSAYLYISDIGTPFQIQIPDSDVPYIYKRYYSSGKWSGWFKLNAGYADSAGSVAWANVTGKPSSYTPSAHTHAWNSLTHSSTTENQAILTNGKANGWKLYTLNISGWNNAANNAHSHANKSVLDGITSGLVNNWNTAYTFVNTITGTDTDKVINKWDEIVNFLAGITEDNKLNTLLNSKLSVYELADKTNVGTIKNNGIYYSTTDTSSGTLTNSPFNTGFALINMTSYDGGDDLRRSRLAFNAYGEIKVSDDRGQANTAETWYNVLTSKNSGISGSTIKLNGTSITVYSSGTADGRYVKKSGDTMTGVLTIDTTNFGALTIKRNDDANGASIQFRGKSSVYGYIGFNAANRNKQLLRWNDASSQIYTILDTSSTYTSNGKGVINGTTITQVDNATNATNSTNARKLVNWYSARPTSLNTQFGDGSLRIFYATSSTTEGKPAEDSHILHLAWDNTGGWDAQLAVHIRSGKVSTRAQNGGTWQPWKTLAFTTDIPSSLKNPYALTISLNGTSQGPYDGSAAKNINITPSSIGAAVSNHSHDYLVVNTADDKSFNSAYHNFQVLYAGGSNGITGKPANVDAFGLFRFRAAAGWSGQMLLANGGSLYIRSSEDAKMTSTLAWKTILDSSNYSSTLDSRYYTESEVNSLLDAKLNRQNLSYGTWNPRGYNLAADYFYNGGNLSISESGGQIHVSVDGYFWQNKGRYRVLDTSDVAGLKGNLTVHQYLSATDTTWWPLIWGGGSHNNTSDSTGAVYKSHDKLSWQTSTQTLYATNIQTENIKHLSIGGGIYWNPYVESASDGNDAASITLVKAGVAGGTTLVLSQMNDANDTIQFKTNAAARLYHNSYPILTTQNTYVSNNKGYINGTEITQVNNADKVDNRHAISTIPNTGIIYKAAIHTISSLTSYWVRLASISSINQNNEFVATIHVQSGHYNPGRSAILLVYLRGAASSLSKSFKICCNSNYNPNRFRLYYKDSDKTSEIWYQTTGQQDGIITTVISQSSEGSLYEGLTLYSGSITAVQTPSMSTYLSAQVSTITDNISGNASTATKLATPRKIWGQSFDGTRDVNGTIYINNGDSENGAIILNNNVNANARISAIKDQVVFNTGAAIRFGATDWKYSDWAGLKYDTVANTIYLGIADGTVFNYYSSKRTNGTLKLPGISNINLDGSAQIRREGSSQKWVNGRNGALLRETSVAGYHALWSLKTTNGSWDFGEYNSGSVWNNIPVLSYITDSNYNSGHNEPTYQIKFPLASGTVALTSDILNYYWANVKISTSSSTTTSPTVHTLTATRVCAGHDPEIDNSISCSNWFRSSGNTGWYNTTYRGGWYMSDTSWIRAHNAVGIYTDGQIYSGRSIRMGNICLEHTDQINNITNGGINLNYRNSGNVSLCQGGGNVGIGTMGPAYKLDVNGQMRASGFHHGSVNSNNYMLLAGGGYKSFGGDDSNPIFLGYLNLDHGNDGTVSSSFSCLGYSVPFTYTRGGNYCRIYIPDTTHQVFYIKAATASVNYSGGGMDTLVGYHRGSGAWWLHCYASGANEVKVKGFRQSNNNNDGWWGGNPLWSTNDGANKITVCIFGYVKFR